MKPLYSLLTLLALCLFASCSSDEPEETYSVYETEWMDTTPTDTPGGGDVLMDINPYLKLFRDNNIPFEINTENSEGSYIGSKNIKGKLTLYLGKTSAKILTSISGTQQRVSYPIEKTSYIFTPGKYELYTGLPTYENPNRIAWIEVTQDHIYLRTENSLYMPDVSTIMILDNYIYRISRQIGEATEETISLEGEGYEGVFNANADPSGVIALSNDDFVFNFIPSTRELTQIRPERIEYGELDLIR